MSTGRADWTLANVLRRLGAERPDHDAFVFGDRRVSFGELDDRSSRVANGLIAAGVGPEDRVAILAANGTEFFDVIFGVSKAAATLVALNWRLAAPELAAILADAEPAVVIVDPDFAHLLPSGAAWRTVTIGEELEAWIEAQPATDPQVPSDPGGVMLILYSSGTTGLPKGIMLTNRNLSFIEVMARQLFRMEPDSVHLIVAPLFHIGGAGTGLTTTTLGGRTIILREVKPDEVLATIERERVTHAFFVPAVIQRLIDSPDAQTRDLSSLRYIAYGAAPMTEALLTRAIEVLGCGFTGCYGMTETAGTVVALPAEEHVADGPRAELLRSVGKALPWHTVRVTDLSTMEEAAPGEVGEIWVRSEMNMKGYLNQPEATAGTLVDGGWVRTGDGAYRDENGYFFLADRIKDMIISGGENIYPAEVENALAGHPDVVEVAVIGVSHEKWGETPRAIVVRRPGTDPSSEELIAFCRERLARYKCPTSVAFIDELPRNPSGKVLKKELREAFATPVTSG